jgi:hypothetical protein
LSLLLAGCVEDIPHDMAPCIMLEVFCKDPVLTKSVPGEDPYNENLISWVDFFFYTGDIDDTDPDDLAKPAKLYRRMQFNSSEEFFKVNVTAQQVKELFPESVSDPEDKDKITVFAIVNHPSTTALFGNDLTHTTLGELYAEVVQTQFADPSRTKQERFMMRGLAVLPLNTTAGRELEGVVSHGQVEMARYASKLTVSVHVPEPDEPVILNGVEKWHPMIDGIQAFLVNGVNTVKLSGKDEKPHNHYHYFDYDKDRCDFAHIDSQTGDTTYTITPPDILSDKVYFKTHPMYMYPQSWEYGSVDTTDVKDCEPYIKLIVPWFRDADPQNGVYSNQRQCYYKVFFPDNFEQKFEMNTWYHLDLDVLILGALTDENAVPINPGSCFIVPWQNDSKAIPHNVSVGVARYLFVERDTIVLRNTESVTFPFLTSHAVAVKDGSFRATRPYYGEGAVGSTAYDGKATIRKATDNSIYPEGTLYLEYNQDGFTFDIDNETAEVHFNHPLKNHYTDKEFDYSPYTIVFSLVHADRVEFVERRVTIIQYPAVYIDRLTNSDSDQVKDPDDFPTQYYSGKDKHDLKSTYWGYTFVDGGAHWAVNSPDIKGSDYCVWKPGVRQERRGDNGNVDMYFHLTSNEDRREYQWRTVWYTGGTMDIYQINVSVLEDDEFVLGDPRTYYIKNPEYSFDGYGEEGWSTEHRLPRRDGFASAPALYYQYGTGDDENEERTLMYYYPTDESNRTIKMLAPKYRVSSKFSGVEYAGNSAMYGYIGGIRKNNAINRCAAYQEDGFPAGRWRLPTRGEVHYIAQLSANEAFAVLFNQGDTYWSAHGPVKIVNKGGGVWKVEDVDTDAALLRCVYDTWYWGEDQTEYDEWRMKKKTDWKNGLSEKEIRIEKRNQFVWGDKPRSK